MAKKKSERPEAGSLFIALLKATILRILNPSVNKDKEIYRLMMARCTNVIDETISGNNFK